MTQYTFILNPKAGRGATARLAKSLRSALRERNVDHDLVFTTRPGEATELARKAAGRYVIAVGGDGTVNEVANGVIGSDKIMGVIPSGSGNDFVKMVNQGKGFTAVLDRLLQGQTRRIDVGTVECSGNGTPGSIAEPRRYFVNGVGIGFDAAVAARTREIKYLRGTFLYLVAVFQMLGKYRAPLFHISSDGRSTEESRHLLIAIGNGTCAGGGFYLTPRAKIDDGVFDVCLIDDVSIGTILHLMPKAMRGKHLNARQVKYFYSKDLALQADGSFYVHADGEIVGRNVSATHITLHANSLEVLRG